MTYRGEHDLTDGLKQLSPSFFSLFNLVPTLQSGLSGLFFSGALSLNWSRSTAEYTCFNGKINCRSSAIRETTSHFSSSAVLSAVETGGYLTLPPFNCPSHFVFTVVIFIIYDIVLVEEGGRAT